MRETVWIRFLYRTWVGRLFLKCLVRPWVSRAAGRLLDTGCSRFLIPHFIRANHIGTEDILVPEGGFSSFNDFFARERVRPPLQFEKGDLICPCDAYASCIPIRRQTVFDIKHTKFTLEELLQDRQLAGEFRDGWALVFRLTPAHYHRYCYAADGMIVGKRRISGVLHCVRPIATRGVPVYIQNAREYQVLCTERFGKLVQMEVGALLVGRIANHKKDIGGLTRAGEEKGYFEFGGSTVLLLVQRNRIRPDERLCRKERGGETAVRQYDVIGRAVSGSDPV